VGALELLLFLFIVFLILGPRRIAGLGRSLGRGVRDFKLEFDCDKEDDKLPSGERDEKPARKR
jgi:TatA/E family protein of Tat protein translocase